LMARFSALFPGKSICYTDIPSMMLPKGLRDGSAELSVGALSAAKPEHAAASSIEPDPTTAEIEPSTSPDIGGTRNIGIHDANEDELKVVSVQSPDASATEASEPGPADYNPIEDLIALAQGTPLPAIDSIPLKQRIAELEKTLIEQALQQAEGNVSQTARILAIQRTTLIEKINKYNLKAQADEPSPA
jgi:sigma-54 specific flagellar transcriptional regulator A